MEVKIIYKNQIDLVSKVYRILKKNGCSEDELREWCRRVSEAGSFLQVLKLSIEALKKHGYEVVWVENSCNTKLEIGGE